MNAMVPTTPKKRGRKKDGFQATLFVRMDRKTHATVSKIAREEDRSLSTVARRLIEKALKAAVD